jgi:hypothetical protein
MLTFPMDRSTKGTKRILQRNKKNTTKERKEYCKGTKRILQRNKKSTAKEQKEYCKGTKRKAVRVYLTQH